MRHLLHLRNSPVPGVTVGVNSFMIEFIDYTSKFNFYVPEIAFLIVKLETISGTFLNLLGLIIDIMLNLK